MRTVIGSVVFIGCHWNASIAPLSIRELYPMASVFLIQAWRWEGCVRGERRCELLRINSVYVFHYFYDCVITDDFNTLYTSFLFLLLLVKYKELGVT
jgi:hypothetical protein